MKLNKKILVLLFSLNLCSTLNAQIFTMKEVYDKFDDVISRETVKTLVSYDDEEGVIVFEEKGKEPLQYDVLDYDSSGSKDDVVNLVRNVYGYEQSWIGMNQSDADNYYESFLESLHLIGQGKEEPEETAEKLTRKLTENMLIITHRVIVDQYTHNYETEFWWIQDTNTGERIIYSN